MIDIRKTGNDNINQAAKRQKDKITKVRLWERIQEAGGGHMISEFLHSVEAAEQEADHILEEADRQCRRIREEALAEAERYRRQIQEELNRKADGMQVTDGGLQLMSGDDPIGSPVELPSASVDIMPIPDTEIDEIMKGEETDGKVS